MHAMNELYNIMINNSVFSLIKNNKEKLNMQGSKSLQLQSGRWRIWPASQNLSSLGTMFKNCSVVWYLVIVNNALKIVIHRHFLIKPALIELPWSKKHKMTTIQFVLQSGEYLIGAKIILFSKEECSFLVTFKPVHSTAIDVTRHNTIPRQQRMLKTFEYGEWLKS